MARAQLKLASCDTEKRDFFGRSRTGATSQTTIYQHRHKSGRCRGLANAATAFIAAAPGWRAPHY